MTRDVTMLSHPRPGIPGYVYNALLNRTTRGADETVDTWGYGLLPGEVTVDGRTLRFWVLPNGKLDARNRYRILTRYSSYETPQRAAFSYRLERALEEKYADDAPVPTVLTPPPASEVPVPSEGIVL